MKVAQVLRYGQKINIKEIAIPKLEQEQSLIKMKYAPINPSDVYFIKGFYGIKKPLPTTGGFEGCGVIQDSTRKDLIGKKVMCWSHEDLNYGTWSTHFICRNKDIIVLDKQIEEIQNNFYKFSSPYINPVTVIGFLDIAQQSNAKSVVLNAANSAVGRMIIKLFLNKGIKTICLVRKDDQIASLLDLGANYVINQNDENFEKKISQIMLNEQTSVFYDAIGGGIFSSVIFKYLIPKGKMVVYGKFSNLKIQDIDPIELVFKQKYIQGFWLSRWIEQKSDEFLESEVKELIKNEIIGIFETRIQQIVPLNQVNEVINQSLSNSGQGKYILDLQI